jgi:3-oxoacyl-[acyl-carrier-protein] synthase-3
MRSVGIRALAIEFPRGLRTNRYFRTRHPDVVNVVESKRLAHVLSAPAELDADAHPFDAAMAKYAGDPFRGTVERRVLTPGETALSLEMTVAQKALAAAGMKPSEVELLIVCSFLPEQFGAMDAAYLARDLGMTGMAFNLESACAGAMVALHTACGLVQAGQYANALVVISCTYSRDTDPRDTLSWSSGDGAGAMIVGPVEAGFGRLGGKCVHSGQTCGALWYEHYQKDDGSFWFRLKNSPSAARAIRDSSEEFVKRCCEGALAEAGVGIADIDAFVFNTPLAWFADFCARTLGADPGRFVDTYPRYANMGPALLPVNLYTAAVERPLEPGDLLLMYSIGSVSSAGAMVLRWGDVALGAPPSSPAVTCD